MDTLADSVNTVPRILDSFSPPCRTAAFATSFLMRRVVSVDTTLASQTQKKYRQSQEPEISSEEAWRNLDGDRKGIHGKLASVDRCSGKPDASICGLQVLRLESCLVHRASPRKTTLRERKHYEEESWATETDELRREDDLSKLKGVRGKSASRSSRDQSRARVTGRG
jgi:hypothetical protein